MFGLDADGMIWAVVIGVLVVGYAIWWFVLRAISRKS